MGSSFGDNCYFSCDTGYELIGDSLVTCISDGNDDDGNGRWDHSAPTCQVLEPDVCFPNPCMNNGTCSSGDDQVSCQCLNGFSGDRCEAKSCKDVQDIEHGSYQYYPNSDGHWPADICRVQYICDPGYQMIGYPDVLCYDGVWSGSPPECKLVQCPPLSTPDNGSMVLVGKSPPNTLNSMAEFSCDDGYEFSSDEDYILACTVDGLWSSEVPHCVPISC